MLVVGGLACILGLALHQWLTPIIAGIGNKIKYSEEELVLLELYEFTEIENGYSIASREEELSGIITIPYEFDDKPIVTIADNAFKDCKNITEIIIPETVTHVGAYAFGGCENLTTVEFSSNTSYIGLGAFSNCVSITEIHLPESLVEIERGNFTEYGAFEGCTALKKLYINSTSLIIPYHAFGECTMLENIYIANKNGVSEMGIYAFANATNIKNIYFGGTANEWEGIIIDETAFHEECKITVHCEDGEIEFH